MKLKAILILVFNNEWDWSKIVVWNVFRQYQLTITEEAVSRLCYVFEHFTNKNV